MLIFQGEYEAAAHFTKSELDKYSLSMQYGLGTALATAHSTIQRLNNFFW